MKYLLLMLTFSIHAFANDEDDWFKDNCTPQNSNSIYKTESIKVDNFNFELTSIKSDARGGEWYDPLCGKSKLRITNDQDESFGLDYTFENGYKPSLWKVIKNKLGEKYALFEQSSGGSAGSYIYVASLQTGEMIDTLPNSWSFEMKGGKLQNTIVEYLDLDLPENLTSSCSNVFNSKIEVYLPVFTTYVNDQKKVKYIGSDDYHFRVQDKEEFMSRCPEVHKEIVQIIESKL